MIKFVPDYKKKCENCGATPVVVGVYADTGKVYNRWEMCGVCTWGEARLLDPDEWNK